jgi:hypothetical protein
LDNASNNQTALDEISNQLDRLGIGFDSVNHKIPCFPHIINLCAQRIINKFSSADFSNVADSWPVGKATIHKVPYVAAVKGDPIKRVRALVKAIRVSPLRREALRKTIASGNDIGDFLDDEGNLVQVPNLELLCDVETRWDSTFEMLRRARNLRPVRLHLGEHLS